MKKDLNITELMHLIYAAATVITEEINGVGDYRLQTGRVQTADRKSTDCRQEEYRIQT